MKVKNYIVENASLFMDCLERELCQQGISYVKIENEIHFENQIVRLYDFEKDCVEIIKCLIMKELREQEQENKISLDSLLIIRKEEEFYEKVTEKLMKSISRTEKGIILEIPELEKTFTEREQCYPKRNRSTLKQESLEVNQKLKKYNTKRKV